MRTQQTPTLHWSEVRYKCPSISAAPPSGLHHCLLNSQSRFCSDCPLCDLIFSENKGNKLKRCAHDRPLVTFEAMISVGQECSIDVAHCYLRKKPTAQFNQIYCIMVSKGTCKVTNSKLKDYIYYTYTCTDVIDPDKKKKKTNIKDSTLQNTFILFDH